MPTSLKNILRALVSLRLRVKLLLLAEMLTGFVAAAKGNSHLAAAAGVKLRHITFAAAKGIFRHAAAATAAYMSISTV